VLHVLVCCCWYVRLCRCCVRWCCHRRCRCGCSVPLDLTVENPTAPACCCYALPAPGWSHQNLLSFLVTGIAVGVAAFCVRAGHPIDWLSNCCCCLRLSNMTSPVETGAGKEIAAACMPAAKYRRKLRYDLAAPAGGSYQSSRTGSRCSCNCTVYMHSLPWTVS
jgi:hypothetical protein